MAARTDRTGIKYGRLTARWLVGHKRGRLAWLCSCDCGGLLVCIGENLGKQTKSCGCLRLEVCSAKAKLQFSHGHTRNRKPTPEYVSYKSAKQRCQDPNHYKYPKYGAAGVKFLFSSFQEFYSELGPRPQGMTCDRYPNPAGNYQTGNVRWATPQQQRDNRRKKAA